MAPVIKKKYLGKSGTKKTINSSGKHVATTLSYKPGAKHPTAGISKAYLPASPTTNSLKAHVPASSGKEYSSPVISSAKAYMPTSSGKNSSPTTNSGTTGKTKFGIMWIPTKKRNKNKDIVYNSFRGAKHRERSPSMYCMPDDSTESHQTKKHEAQSTFPVRKEMKLQMSTAQCSSSIATTDNSDISNMEVIQMVNKSVPATDKLETDHINLEIGDNEGKAFLDMPAPKDKVKDVDKVDNATPAPAKKLNDLESNVQEESCGITCLYYIMECCECVIT